MPTRHYVRTSYFFHTWPAEKAMRCRNQAWWNLIWLVSPEVDQALQVVDESSRDRYRKSTGIRMLTLHRSLLRLIKDQSILRGDIPLDKALKTLQPERFVDYFETLHFMKTKVFKEHGRELLDIMRSRAKLANSGSLHLLNSPDCYPYSSVTPGEFEKVIAPSVIARLRWLHDATALLEEHVLSVGFKLPPTTFEIDSFTSGRVGFCSMSHEGEANHIAISSVYFDATDVLETLTHELVHAIDNCAHGHYPKFVKIASKIGLVGNAKEHKPNDRLKSLFEEIRKEIGTYPHFKVAFH